MDGELRKIKKKYGEEFAKMCREMFPIILEEEGKLYKIITENFAKSHFLYDDIINSNSKLKFKNYIYSIYHNDKDNQNKLNVTKTPKDLLDEAGYDFYECKTEEHIQKFKKYYAPNEELCTFNGGRLDRCEVFWVVKKNVNDIKRENFDNPKREDEYGTSVMSIQFTKDETNTLSIKNRYNHRVNNPDATYSNNLDNIVDGLTESFEKYYGIVQKYKSGDFELPDYIRGNDGKYYKYNYEIDNVYYCPNNVVIDNFEVKKYDREKYIVLDYFILDLVNKKIELYETKNSEFEIMNMQSNFDSFVDIISEILEDKDSARINITKDNDEKVIEIKNSNKKVEIVLDKYNRIIKYRDHYTEEVGKNFLILNKVLRELDMSNLKRTGRSFLDFNKELEVLKLENLEDAESYFISDNCLINEIHLPKLIKVGDNFLCNNQELEKVSLENIEEVGDGFICSNKLIKEVYMPKLKKAGFVFLAGSVKFKTVVLDLNVLNDYDRDKIKYILNINNKESKERKI